MRPLVLLPLLATAALAQAQSDTPDKVRVTVETGYVWQNKNDVAVPRSGTNFSFPDLIGRGPTGFLRITVLTTPDAKNGCAKATRSPNTQTSALSPCSTSAARPS
jgi:hypothetical protein